MTQEKDINYWKNNCEENYITTPISVLRYISELEKLVTPSKQEKLYTEEQFKKSVIEAWGQGNATTYLLGDTTSEAEQYYKENFKK
jgi:hypothetical protein